MKETILKLEHISYSYGEAQLALQDFSAEIAEGEKIAVLGNNGAGKSTFFLCCNGVLKPCEGTLYLKGDTVDFSRKSLTKLRQAVGLVFQEPDSQLLAGTVEAEVSFGPMNLNLSAHEVETCVTSAIEDMALQDYRTRAPQYLSGGEKKRVTLADVLAMQPKIMLLDEPAASLDPENAQLLEENLGKMTQKGIALVIATHDVDFAWRWADRIFVMHRGQLLADSTPENIFADTALLKTCGLKQPLLWQVADCIGIAPPRNIDAFRKAVQA